MKESKMYNRLKQKLKLEYPRIVFQRIETGSTAIGVFDIFYRTKHHDGWIELKQIRITKGIIKIPFGPGQFEWGNRYVLTGGRAFVFGTAGNTIYIIPGHRMKKEYNFNDFHDSCIYIESSGQWDYEFILNILDSDFTGKAVHELNK